MRWGVGMTELCWSLNQSQASLDMVRLDDRRLGKQSSIPRLNSSMYIHFLISIGKHTCVPMYLRGYCGAIGALSLWLQIVAGYKEPIAYYTPPR